VTTQLWISTANNPDRTALGQDWLHAGSLDERRESDLWKVVQGQLGHRAPSTRRSVAFYADLDPTSPGYKALTSTEPHRPDADDTPSAQEFWLALRWNGPPVRVFFGPQARRARRARATGP
jgi:hypothetical protein